MKLTLHIVQKDFRRMRGWLIGWVAVLLLPIVIGFRLLSYNPLANESWSLPTTLDILTGFEVIVGYMLTILLLHEDKVVGTEQFWLTRPISRGRMLRAKMLGAFAMVGLIPVVVTLPWWLWCGFGIGQVVHAAAETLGVLAMVIAAGALMATLTESLSRAMLWTLVLVAVALFVMLFFTISIATRGPEEASLVVARSVVVVVVVTLELAAVMMVQFLVRRRGWWLAPAAGLIVVTIVAASRWPWPWIPAEPPERNVERAAGAVLRYEGAAAYPVQPRVREQNPSQRIESSFVLAGIDPGLVVVPTGGWQAWRWADASIERRSQFYMPNWGQVQNWLTGMRWPAEFQDGSAPAAEADQELRAHAPLPPSMVARMRREPARFDTKVWLQLGRPEIICEVPLRAGGRETRYGLRMNVSPLITSDVWARPASENGVVVQSTQPITVAELLSNAATQGSPFRAIGRNGTLAGYYALNREKGEFVPLVSHKTRQIVVAGVRMIWTVYDFPAPWRRPWTPSESWRAGASVAAVWMHDEAVIARELRVSPFILTK